MYHEWGALHIIQGKITDEQIVCYLCKEMKDKFSLNHRVMFVSQASHKLPV